MPKLDDAEFEKILDSQINEAASWQEEHFSQDRERNYKAYLGEAAPAPEGRSQAVSWDVFETIESALPDLIEILCGGDTVAAFEPVGEEDEAFSEQATDYINYIALKQNPGFLIFNTWIKDALLSKIGVVRAYWATTEKVVTRDYTGLDANQLTMLMDQEGAEVTAQSSQDDPLDVEQRQRMVESLNVMAPDQRMAAAVYLQSPVRQLYDVTIKCTRKKSRTYIDNVQPENFIISARAKTLAAADIVGEMKALTRSDMRELGYPEAKVKTVQSFDVVADQTQGIAQTASDETADPTVGEDSPDDATEPVLVFDGFIRLDYDGDGIAEWRRVVRGSNATLVNEEAEGHDFAVMSPILIPHRLIGMALADPVLPLQQSSTTMLRQYTDSLVLANNPRTAVLDGQVNLDDLLNNRIGGIVRVKALGAAAPLQTANVADSALQGIEFNDSKREARTGITRYNQGLDADTLNKTATGVTKIMSAGDARKKMMARIMAETGIKDLFRLLLRIVTDNQDKAATYRLRGEWVRVDPSPWNPEMDVTIEPGQGTGDKSQTVQTLQGVLEAQKEALAAGLPLVDTKKIYNTLDAILKAAGIKGTSKYFNDPDQTPPGQPQGTPQGQDGEPNADALAQAQVKAAELDLQGKQLQIEANMQAKQADVEIEKVKLQQAQVQLAIKERELAIKEAELQIKQQDLRLKAAKDAADTELKAREQDRKDIETAAGLVATVGIPV
ncbi:OmpH family outer membrane protein [Achromobacter denitrificans]|uniref:portal protein n=1 Tax=Achromobacter denitrificans TaxID=32002 RepID=UPI0023E899B6|nr:OmpH family outer membrane protein [Achromobacter denitrificans]MDF3858091.1 OmpH family outer membrane protein [Achromobacter denitrificans]